jgi:hypothetical protein
MDNPAILNAQLAKAHIRTGLCALQAEQGQRLSHKARTILEGIIRQAQEALAADDKRASE